MRTPKGTLDMAKKAVKVGRRVGYDNGREILR